MGMTSTYYIDNSKNPMSMITLKGELILKELLDIGETEAKASFVKQRINSGSTSGKLFASFSQRPITQHGAMELSGIIFSGGPSAPYAPYVEWIGWGKTNKRAPYHYMREGRDKLLAKAKEVVTRKFSTIR